MRGYWEILGNPSGITGMALGSVGCYWGANWDVLVPQELSELPDYPKIRFRRQDPAPLEQLVPEAKPAARDLLRRFLRYPSRQRIRAHQVGGAPRCLGGGGSQVFGGTPRCW